MTNPESPRVLLTVFGSAGDLFPLVPLLHELLDRGCDVRCAAPRSLGLYLRLCGIPSVALGDGSELGVITDPGIFTLRSNGWASWRRVLVHYVAPSLIADTRQLERLFADWRPDVVVASSFSAAGRIAAWRARLPLVTCSIYPQHEQIPAASLAHFARPFRRAASALTAPGADPGALALGAPADLLLHDPNLLAPDPIAARAVGFPYWDGVAGKASDLADIDAWLERPGPHVLVTLGSFVGLAQRRAWLLAADAIREIGASALFVGVRGPWARQVFAVRSDLCCVGFVPLSAVLERFDAVIHHGGIGTMIATIRAGRPAVVLPQAFDQGHNARLVERIGVGCDGSSRALSPLLGRLLGDGALRRRTVHVATTIVSTRAAVEAASDRILDPVGAAT